MKRGHNKRKLTDEQVIAILTSTMSDSKTAALHGVSKTAIGHIRTGQSFAYICPDLPRRSNKVCTRCLHWEKDRCNFGFPDPIEDGPSAAQYCNLFCS